MVSTHSSLLEAAAHAMPECMSVEIEMQTPLKLKS